MRLKLVSMVLLAAALLYAAVQPQLPETPAARQLSGWLAAFNSADRDALYPQVAARIDQLMQFRSQVGGFDLKKIEESTPTRLTGIMKERNSERFARFDEVEGGVRCFGHGGGAPGMNGDLKICPASGYVIAVLANLDPPAAQRISGFVANRLPEK